MSPFCVKTALPLQHRASNEAKYLTSSRHFESFLRESFLNVAKMTIFAQGLYIPILKEFYQ